MRRVGGYEYNDNFLIVQAPCIKSQYKVAIKIPAVQIQQNIQGLLEITSNSYSDKIEIPIKTKIAIPRFVSERMMQDKEIGLYHMKFGLKNAKRQDFKISFRNKGDQILQAEFLVEKSPGNPDYDAAIHPTSVNVLPGGQCSTSLIVKESPSERQRQSGIITKKDIRCQVLAKFKNCSAIFTFPCLIQHQY